MKSVDIARRGGTYVIGVKREGSLKTEERGVIGKKLSSVAEENLKLTIDKHPFEIPLGFSKVDLEALKISLQSEEAVMDRLKQIIDSDSYYQKIFGRLISEAEQVFYSKLIEYLISLNSQYKNEKKLQTIFAKRTMVQDIGLLDSLISSFFISKRAFERSSHMMELLKTKDYGSSKYKLLRELMERINSYSSGKDLNDNDVRNLGIYVSETFLQHK